MTCGLELPACASFLTRSSRFLNGLRAAETFRHRPMMAIRPTWKRGTKLTTDRALESSESLESNALAEKEGFEPSISSKRHGNRLGFPSEGPDHG
jgi:hypothetical protein